MKMVDQGTKRKTSPQPVMPEEKSSTDYPSLELKNLDDCPQKVGSECTITIKGKLTAIKIGDEYGPDKGKNVGRYRFDVLSAAIEGAKSHSDYTKDGAAKRDDRARELIEAAEDEA